MGSTLGNRKRLRDGAVMPRSQVEQVEHEKQVNYQRRTRARDNTAWMRQEWAGCDWTDTEYGEILAMLGLDTIDADDRYSTEYLVGRMK